MNKELVRFASDLLDCMKPIQYECLCIDPPEKDTPVNHSDYCPVYLYDLIERVKNKYNK